MSTLSALKPKTIAATQTELDAGAGSGYVGTPELFVRHGYVDALTKYIAWEAPQSPSRTPKGTRRDPFRVNTSTLLDTLLKSFPENTIINLLADSGEFLTYGYSPDYPEPSAPDFILSVGFAPLAGQKFYGVNGRATIKLDVITGYVNNRTHLFHANDKIYGYTVPPPTNGVELDNLLLDCNYQNQDTAVVVHCGGVFISGQNIKLNNLIINNYGSRSNSTFELFVCQLSAEFDASHNPIETYGLEMTNIQFGSIANLGASGCSMLTAYALPKKAGVTSYDEDAVGFINGLVITDIRYNGPTQACVGLGPGGTKGTRISGCYLNGIGSAYYYESNKIYDTIVRDSRFLNSSSGIFLNITSDADVAAVIGMLFENVTVSVRDTDEQRYPFKITSPTLGQCVDVIVRNCRFLYSTHAARAYDSQVNGLIATNVNGLCLQNNQVECGSAVDQEILDANLTGTVMSSRQGNWNSIHPKLDPEPLLADADARPGTTFLGDGHDGQFCFKDGAGNVKQLTFP